VDAAPPQPVLLTRLANSSEGEDQASPELRLKELCGFGIEELWRQADGASVGLEPDELATVLLRLGLKHNYGVPPGTAAARAQIGAFWRGLQLEDLALAHACALGREAAWQVFIARFREPLTQAAIGITGSVTAGQELADSLYAELFGLTERGEQRGSPLAYYSGRGSLKGFLRATLAQRNVDHFRRAKRETSIGDEEIAAASPVPAPPAGVVERLRKSVAAALGALRAEERFLLSAWFLDRRTLLEISRVLRVHEATVSRRLQRLIAGLHKDLLKNLQSAGLSKAAAEEALGTDPRDLDMNLRSLLQGTQSSAFLDQGAPAEAEQT
jgi:RNA polymerase sigma-70 factor (ECF subfamily)